jgi:hypothetical protein
MLTAPRPPASIRAFNTVSQPFVGIAPLFSLDPEALLRSAQKKTGLEDFGDPWFREGLDVLLRALREEAELTPTGRTVARGDILMALQNRLHLQHWRTKHPEIAQEPVERPIVIIGMGRTGTTILHNLFAQDERNRTPLTWEVDRPFPPPEREKRDDDPRIAEVQAYLDRVDRLIPDFKKMHPMGALHPQECVRILSNELASMVFELSFHVPSYRRWLHEKAELSKAYQGHRRTLQHLQWRSPGRWVLKSPCHLWHLAALLGEYPDAVLVQTHRDPLSIISSMTSLGTTLRSMAGRAVDPKIVAEEWSKLHAYALNASVDARDSGLIEPSRVIDIQFREFLSDPIRTVRKVYAHADLDLTPEAERRIRVYWEANPSDKHGRHEHRFSETGLDLDEERDRIRRYQEYFDVPVEVQR